jgi:long-chain fatty acid transport protein
MHMIATRRVLALLAVSAGLLSSTAIPAFAGAFGLREQSAEGQGMSFAGMAAGAGGLSSMFWNPATMTDSPGITSSLVGSGIFPGGSIKPNPVSPTAIFGGTNNVILDGFVPAGYGAYQFNDKLWLGYSTNAPFGLESSPGYAWAGQVYGRSAKVFSFAATPSIAYKINDWISVGVGLQVEYFKTRLSQALGVLPTSPSAIIEGDDIGVGYTLGVTLKPTAWTEVGVGFRSSVHESLSGTLTTPASVLPVNANINLPEMVTAGIRQKISAQWTLLGGFEWDNWSRVNIMPVTFGGVPVTDVPFKYKDGYMTSLGVEYAWNEALTLRTGVAYEWSPIDLSNREVLLPDGNRIWASIGATYHYSNKLSFDVGYSHGFLAKSSIAVVPGAPQFPNVGLPFVARVKNARFDIISAAITYRWDDPTQPIPVAQPIVRKY